MERFLLVSFALCLCFAEVTAQCRWDFDLNITQQMNSTYPPPKSLVCGLFASDTVTFVNQGSQAYYVVRLDGSAGFSSCDMSAGTIIESMPFPLMIPANGQLSFTLSRATSGFWDFFVSSPSAELILSLLPSFLGWRRDIFHFEWNRRVLKCCLHRPC